MSEHSQPNLFELPDQPVQTSPSEHGFAKPTAHEVPEAEFDGAISKAAEGLVDLMRDWAARTPGGRASLRGMLSNLESSLKRSGGSNRLLPAPESTAIYPAIFQLKVTLREIRPPIWRRLLVPSNVTLARLHRIIQNAMGWWNYHLYQFTISDEEFSEGEDLYGSGFLQATGRRLFELDLEPKQHFRYEYDFGDGWEHDVLLERVLRPDLDELYPVCNGGARAAPPEDCGGPGGYEDVQAALADPSHERHDELCEWVGELYDAELFDADIVNLSLRRATVHELKSARDRALGWRVLALADGTASRRRKR